MKNGGLKSDIQLGPELKNQMIIMKNIKAKLASDDKLPLNKAIEIPVMVIAVTALFRENSILSTSFFRKMSL